MRKEGKNGHVFQAQKTSLQVNPSVQHSAPGLDHQKERWWRGHNDGY